MASGYGRRLRSGALLLALAIGGAGPRVAPGGNPHPVVLMRPQATPLSAMAQVGERIFFDASLSGSGRESCVSCHSPAHAYGPPTGAAAVLAGIGMKRQGVRAVPSLMYLDRQPLFSVGPDNEENETTTLAQMVAAGQDAARATKTAAATAQSAANIVPQGGLFWDGRVDTLQQQALVPMLNPIEMAGGSVATVAAKLRNGPYAASFVQLFGAGVFDNPRLLVAEAMFAVTRYQIESVIFHPYTSKFDYWLEGRARLNPAELRGYLLFNDPKRSDCGGCHLDEPGRDGTPPLFTDHQFEALSAPRNPELQANRDPQYFDLGICGPYRSDMRHQTQFCGMFLTPTLRNVATRHVFFHNGVFHTLQQVLDFYAFRDVDPEKVYPRGPDGRVEKDNDIPPRYRANVDVTDPPFDRHPGEKPAMTEQDERDVIAFLATLTDGWRPEVNDAPADHAVDGGDRPAFDHPRQLSTNR